MWFKHIEIFKNIFSQFYYQNQQIIAFISHGFTSLLFVILLLFSASCIIIFTSCHCGTALTEPQHPHTEERTQAD